MASKSHAGAATTWGSPGAPKAAVLIHGLSASSQTWIDVAPELVKEGYYVVAPDLLGHGMAPRSNSYQIEDFVANIAPRLADRHIDLLIGHSLGGPVSLGLYPHLKTKPKRLVLVDPLLSSDVSGEAFVEASAGCEALKPKRKANGAPKALENDDKRLDAAKTHNLNDIKTRPSPEEFQKHQPNWTPNACVVKSLAACLASADAVEYICTKLRPWSFTKHLPLASDGVDIVIIGADPGKDRVFMPEEAEALAKTRPDIKCMVAKGSGHGIQREQPGLIVRAALEPISSL